MQGRGPFEKAVRGVMAAVPGSKWTIDDLLVDGDRVAIRTTWSGTYNAPQFLLFWDGERFFISTTRARVKYKIFKRDPRVELIIDDATGHRYARVSGTVEVLEDMPTNLPMDRAIREKHGIPVAADEELAASLVADNRVLLAVTPSKPASEWSVLGVEA